LRTVKDIFFVDADFNANKTMDIKGADGERLYIDIDFDPYAYATRIGAITHTPLIIGDKYKYLTKLDKGDIVIFHHFVCQEDNRVIVDGKHYFKADFCHLFAKIKNNTVTPLEQFIFVRPIKDEVKFMGKLQISFEDKNLKSTGIIEYLSEEAKGVGLKVGDKVFYTKNAEYKMNILGTEFYRMRIRNILLVERDGDLICLNDRLLLKAIKKTGMWVTGNEKALTAEVCGVMDGESHIAIGDIIGYSRGLDYPIEYKGVEYLLTRRENANYLA